MNIHFNGGFSSLFFGLLFGAICATVADNRGRSQLGWFVGGFFFSIPALILVAVLPNRKHTEQRHRAHAKVSSRLRERMRHDRSVSDRRFGDLERRLEAHDVALGLDTKPRSSSAFLEGTAPPGLPGGGTARRSQGLDSGTGSERVWYFSNDSRSRSAAPAYQLRSLYKDGRINGGTLVWTDGMGDWRTLSEVPELEEALRA